MNIMGVGLMELGVIFVVAFLVLGPSRSIGMAKTAGKVSHDLRRTLADMTAVVNLDQDSPLDGRLAAPPADPQDNNAGRDRE